MHFADYTIHPWAQKVPEISSRDFADLKANIEQNGQQFPIIRAAGGIIDGRSRLKVCLELGIQPRIEEYAGTLSVEQFILSTNIRRNLTKLQRDQLMADFAPAILPQVKAEMKERQKRKSVATNSVGDNCSRQNHPGYAAVRSAMGASDRQARNLTAIHENAPELLPEVAARGGLAKTAKEARKRKAEKQRKSAPAKPRLSATERRIAHETRLDAGPRLSDMVLSAEQIDPELANHPIEFARQHGHVSFHTKAERLEDKDKVAFTEWRGAMNAVRAKLRVLAKMPPFTNKQLAAWLNAPAEHASKRYNDLEEAFNLLAQAHAAVVDHAAWLPSQKPQPVPGGNGSTD